MIGRDMLGGAFNYDPFELYEREILTNPNMVVFGQIGRGKSSFVKTYLWRQAVFGRRAWVIDPKGEYGPLADAWGVKPIALHPGGTTRINPLDEISVSGNTEGCRQAGELLVSLAAAGLGRALLPNERTAVELAVSACGHARRAAPTIPQVVEQMLLPDAESAAALHVDVQTLASDGRSVALELRRLVAGDLRGMFDGSTSPGIDLSGPLVVLDLSAVYHSGALGVLMACAAAWLQSSLGKSTGSRSIFVVDEAWAILANLGVARWLQSSWKLSRARGVSNVAVLHRVSDLTSVASAGSGHAGLVQGLLADSETRVIYGQPPGETEPAAELLGLSNTETELVPKLSRGCALWKVGGRSFLVQHILSPKESAIVDTDSNMSSAAAQPPNGHQSNPGDENR